MISGRKTPLPDVGGKPREVQGGTSKDDFIARLQRTPNTPAQSVREQQERLEVSSKFCIMLGHKQGYEVVTDPSLVAQMGKKII